MLQKLIKAMVMAFTLITTPVVAETQMNRDINCLALNVYHESRGEPVEGQIAVAYVTMNRVEHDHWPETICDVVYQKHQFSWVKLKKDHTPRNEDLWETAQYVARNVYEGLVPDNTNGSVFYHANYVNPSWAKKHHTIEQVRIGVHIFYTWKGYWS